MVFRLLAILPLIVLVGCGSATKLDSAYSLIDVNGNVIRVHRYSAHPYVINQKCRKIHKDRRNYAGCTVVDRQSLVAVIVVSSTDTCAITHENNHVIYGAFHPRGATCGAKPEWLVGSIKKH